MQMLQKLSEESGPLAQHEPADVSLPLAKRGRVRPPCPLVSGCNMDTCQLVKTQQKGRDEAAQARPGTLGHKF